MQQTVCKYMASLFIGGQLNLVNHHTVDITFKRHRLDRATEIARIGRDDFFLACYQRHLRSANAGDNLVIIFSCQQAKRKAYHAGGMAKHPVHRIEGLAGIGRPQHTFNGFI